MFVSHVNLCEEVGSNRNMSYMAESAQAAAPSSDLARAKAYLLAASCKEGINL